MDDRMQPNPVITTPDSATDDFVLLVTFDLFPGHWDEFLNLVTTNARNSLTLEPECRRFDVLAPATQADRVVLYEFYISREAFEDHCRRPHFLEFDAAVKSMVRDKSFVQFSAIAT